MSEYTEYRMVKCPTCEVETLRKLLENNTPVECDVCARPSLYKETK